MSNLLQMKDPIDKETIDMMDTEVENVVILDTETTGLRPEQGDKIIEVAAILFNVKHKIPLQTYSTLFRCETNPVEHINGIKPEWTQATFTTQQCEKVIGEMLNSASCIVAHNAKFDRGFCQYHLPSLYDKKWICTKDDFKWHVHLYRYRQQDICEALGVEYVNAHRALNDVLLLMECLKKVPDLEARLNRAITFGATRGFGGGTRNQFVGAGNCS